MKIVEKGEFFQTNVNHVNKQNIFQHTEFELNFIKNRLILLTFQFCLYYFCKMQYNNIANMRVPQKIKKSPMAASHFFTLQKQDNNDIQTLNKSETLLIQKGENKETINIPTFLNNRKPQSVSQSLIFNNPIYDNSSTFQNPFTTNKYTRGSFQENKKQKQQHVPKFLKTNSNLNKQDSVGKGGFYKKFKSPQSIRQKHSLFSSGSINRDIAANQTRSRADSKTDSTQQNFSPIHPKRFLHQKKDEMSTLQSIKLKFSQMAKQKNDFSNANQDQNQKNSTTKSQKIASKIPQFIKKSSPQNLINTKELSVQQLNKSQRLFYLNKVKHQVNTQPQSPIEKKMSFESQPRHSYNGGIKHSVTNTFTNYVEIPSTFSKKKPSQFMSSNYAKVSNTPQSIPVKPQYPNFEFGRLSSPSALNNRRRIDSNYVSKQFKLQDFELVNKIGKGAFGDVYMAQEKVTGFLCVLKKVSKKKIKQMKLQQNILRQIKIQMFLKHKHLTTLYGFFADQQYMYLILQILPDGSMNQVKKKKRTPQHQVSKYIRQVCQGLRYMHKQQIIHRDLKPQNIFMNQEYIKIGDFGCAVYTQTLRKTMVGCLAYISPEQLNNDFYDDKIDIWSLGILTYEMITGKAPFQQDIVKSSLQQIKPQFSKVTFPEDLQISDVCRNFIQNLLELNPQDRLSIDQAMKHPFITKILEQQRNEQQEVFGGYQAL